MVAKPRQLAPPPEIWDETERLAWTIDAPLRPSDWPELYRSLDLGQSSVPGPMRNAMAPYMRLVIDLIAADGVERVFVEKAAQIGVSDGLRSAIGYIADRDPGPWGLVLPDKVKGRKIVSDRWIPFFNGTPRLQRLLPGAKAAIQKEQIKLANGFSLNLAWAGSASSTSADPWRGAIIDEFDKTCRAVCSEPDLLGRVTKRMYTFGERSKLLCVGTPTDEFSEIHAAVEGANYVLWYMTPCPHCGGWQYLSDRQITCEKPPELASDKRRLIHWFRQDDSRVWYECLHCKGRIYETQRPAMIRAGKWCTANAIDDRGRAVAAGTDLAAGVIFDAEALCPDGWPRGTSVGLRIWEAHSLLGPTLAKILSEWFETELDPTKKYSYDTETCGRPSQHQRFQTPEGVYKGKVTRATMNEGVVPAWCGKLLAAIDTQIDSFYVVIRAWGEDFRSQRIWHANVASFEEVETWCRKTPWPSEDATLGVWRCEMAAIDSGGTTDELLDESRTLEVYRWAQRNRSWVRPLKGAALPRNGQYIWRGRGVLEADAHTKLRRQIEVPIWWCAKHYWQCVLEDLVNAGLKAGKPIEGEEETWLLNRRADEEYEKHLANVKQTVARRGGRAQEIWTKVHPGGRVDYRDCEVYQLVAANLARIDMLPSTPETQAFRRDLTSGALDAQNDTSPVAGFVERFRRRHIE